MPYHHHDKAAALEALRDAMPGNSTQAQCARLREALSRFPITTFEAMRFLDCYDPRARVMQLRKAGERINTHWTKEPTECGTLHRIGLYTLIPTNNN